ncbi:VirB3 family type IV secretion system protein [Yersinia enterocolitica]
MVTLNKALTRPAMLFGIPMVPLVIVSGAINLGNFHYVRH